MSQKSFILSASGLKNIVTISKDGGAYLCSSKSGGEDIKDDDIFRFILGDHEIRINRILADFISPRVSQIHSADPTINYIDLSSIIKNFPKSEEVFTPDMINIFLQLASGDSVEVDVEMSHKLRILSILLENQEIYDKMNEIYPIKDDETNIESIIKYLQYFGCYKNFDSCHTSFNNKSMIDLVSSKFYSIDQSSLLRLSNPVLYSIISSDQLKLKNEDSLLDFINQIFSVNENDNGDSGLNKTAFYELIDFSELSENKFKEFVDNFNPSELSTALWQKLALMMTLGKNAPNSKKKNPNRYIK